MWKVAEWTAARLEVDLGGAGAHRLSATARHGLRHQVDHPQAPEHNELLEFRQQHNLRRRRNILQNHYG